MMDEQSEQIGEQKKPPPPRRRRRGAPWLLGGLVLLLLTVLVALQVFGLWEIFTPDTATDTLLLYALSSLNFVAFFIFTFIFVRNLLKLRRERRERQLGSKIKTRLVVYFITVSLLPITAMAVFSYIFFNRSLEKWFSSLPEDVFNEARAVQRIESLRQTASLRELAATAAALLEAQAAGDAEASLQMIVERGRLSLLAIVPSDGTTRALSVAAPFASQPDLHERLLQPALAAGPGESFTVAAGKAAFDVVVLPLAGERRLIAARAQQPDPRLGSLVAGAKTFEDFKRRQRKVRLLGLSTLGLLTLVILFAATWSAIHLARGIAMPIRALAEASDEVARGNLHHRVTAVADDELALLAASFNQMTEQLAENRRYIEAGAAELREKNLALAERRDYIETVLESLSTGVISLDANDRVTTINAAALSILQVTSPPPAGTSLGELIGAGDGAALSRIVARARLRGRAAEQVELVRSTAHENESGIIPVALTATALIARSGGGRGVVLVMEDLSELLAAQRAAAWSEVARRMAHEIKNPLTPIQLSAERIARNFHRNGARGELPAGVVPAAGQSNGEGSEPPPPPPQQQQARVARVVEECTATITREVAGLKAMVDEFTRFARLPHARLTLSDLNTVASQAIALYEDRLDGVRMEVRLAPALPGAMLDAEQLRRVFVNLIDNALEALTQADGERRITIATGHDPGRGLLLAEVIDTGHGIARADFSRLFQPYFSTRGRGTGLGLAIVHRIIIEHRGRIRAETNRPRGARIIFELPVAEDARQETGGSARGGPAEDI